MLNQSRESRTSSDDLAFFLRVASLGSLTAAARALGLSLAAVSKRLSLLEQRLGFSYCAAPRAAGTDARRPSISGRGSSVAGAVGGAGRRGERETAELRGTLNINASFGFGRRHIAPCVSAFAALHPHLALSLQLSSQPLNFLDAHVDIDIRVGEPPDSRLVARKLVHNPRVLCCSPAYAAKHGLPDSIRALAQHNCILLRQHDSDFALWRFVGDAESLSQKVRGTSSRTMARWRCAWRWMVMASCCALVGCKTQHCSRGAAACVARMAVTGRRYLRSLAGAATAALAPHGVCDLSTGKASKR